MVNGRIISPLRVRERVTYDSATGEFFWLQKPGNDRLTNSWNARYSGQKAGSVARGKGYRFIDIDYVRFTASNVAWAYITGEWPRYLIDHKNGVRDDDRFKNLREATYAQNNLNTGPYTRRIHSLPRGVQPYNKTGKWLSMISINGKQTRLGIFDTVENAHWAYSQAALKYHGQFARTE